MVFEGQITTIHACSHVRMWTSRSWLWTNLWIIVMQAPDFSVCIPLPLPWECSSAFFFLHWKRAYTQSNRECMSSNNARNHIFILFKMHIAHCHSRITGFELKSEIEAPCQSPLLPCICLPAILIRICLPALCLSKVGKFVSSHVVNKMRIY